MIKKIGFYLIAIGAFTSCNDDEIEVVSAAEQLAIDTEIINNYLLENNLTAQSDASGLQYAIAEEGDGATPEASDNVVVTYEGRFLSNGQVFDSFLEEQGIEFPLNRLILGWQIGIPLIKEGGSITLYVPSGLAYGPNGTGNGSIPGNAVLIFDIDLLEVK